MSEKIFVLGVGAQKAGTTWLHRYLNGFDDVSTGFMKEYHIWDARDLPSCKHFKVRLWPYLRKKLRFKTGERVVRYEMQNRFGAYEAYFRSVAGQGYRVTGDITPSYALLTEKTLAEIMRRLEASGFEVKVVFLLRDPVERCWSAVRMFRRGVGPHMTPEQAELSEAEHLRQVYRTPHFRDRTLYQQTAARLEACFDADNIFYGIYEDLFTRQTLERLSEFLNVPVDLARTQEVFNRSPKKHGLEADLRAEIADYYRDTYAFCLERFPETRELWRQ